MTAKKHNPYSLGWRAYALLSYGVDYPDLEYLNFSSGDRKNYFRGWRESRKLNLYEEYPAGIREFYHRAPDQPIVPLTRCLWPREDTLAREC